MSFDDLLKDAWQGQAQAPAQHDLTRRVRRRQMRLRLLRTLEVALTIIAVLVFGQALLSGRVDPAHWLLMPFFLAFLPMAWIFVLRSPRRHAADATGSASTYARLRLAQLRTGLRDLWLARTTAWVLLAYALVVNAGVWVLGGSSWREAGLALLLMAVAAMAVTLWLSRTLRQRWLREYRGVYRIIGG